MLYSIIIGPDALHHLSYLHQLIRHGFRYPDFVFHPFRIFSVACIFYESGVVGITIDGGKESWFTKFKGRILFFVECL
ncbi:hypothetical protein HY58_00575 [Flavihumibacter sp. ZG627]|nr:hypothetical protein HY58_00575 [Flavihumibacter sp. ZG627]